MNNAVIFLAGGSGSRMRGSVKDKILAELVGKPVILHSVENFLKNNLFSTFVFVCKDDEQISKIKILTEKFLIGKIVKFTYGGAERQDSVYNGLSILDSSVENVFIHDSARPMLGITAITNLLNSLNYSNCAVLVNRVIDTIKRIQTSNELINCELEDLDRSKLWAMQTPQAFDRKIILEAYKNVKEKNLHITDDVAAASIMGHKITLVENHFPNPKITLPEDLDYIEFLISKGKYEK